MNPRSNDEVEIIAYPGTYLTSAPQPGDRLTRWSPSEGIEYDGVIVSDRPESAASLIARGVPVESAGGGQYVEVLELAPGSTRSYTVGRRLADPSGRVPRQQAVTRPPSDVPGAQPAPAADPYASGPQYGYYGGQPGPSAPPPPGAYYPGEPAFDPYGNMPAGAPATGAAPWGLRPQDPYGIWPAPASYAPPNAPPAGAYGTMPGMEPMAADPFAAPAYGPAGAPQAPFYVNMGAPGYANVPVPDPGDPYLAQLGFGAYGQAPPAGPYPNVPGTGAYLGGAPRFGESDDSRAAWADSPIAAPLTREDMSEDVADDTESVGVDDVAAEMNGLRAQFEAAITATRSDGSSRTFSSTAIVHIGNWNGLDANAELDGFPVPKLAISPKYDLVAGVREYVLPLEAQRRAVAENSRQLSDWAARESSYARNHATWERERARLATLLDRRRHVYSRMWVRRMMYNRFDFDIARWTNHYNRMFTPATPLDPNIPKSMFYQESRFGTSGEHLMPPPSDWSSGTNHPIRSRFNIGQAIDSWGPQQWLMIREMAPAVSSKHRLDALATGGRWFAMTNSDYSSHPTFMTALREFFEMRASGSNLMGTPGRDLHEDYTFWIRTAIRWLFEKFQRLSSPGWSDAVRAYNGGGAGARKYRDEVMARVGTGDPFTSDTAQTVDESNGTCATCGHAGDRDSPLQTRDRLTEDQLSCPDPDPKFEAIQKWDPAKLPAALAAQAKWNKVSWFMPWYAKISVGVARADVHEAKEGEGKVEITMGVDALRQLVKDDVRIKAVETALHGIVGQAYETAQVTAIGEKLMTALAVVTTFAEIAESIHTSKMLRLNTDEAKQWRRQQAFRFVCAIVAAGVPFDVRRKWGYTADRDVAAFLQNMHAEFQPVYFEWRTHQNLNNQMCNWGGPLPKNYRQAPVMRQG